MYNEGARKFGFFSLPPLGCWPSVREANGDCVENVTSIMQLHNKEFSKSIKKLDQQLERFTYSKFDLYTSISDRMNNPSKYGMHVCFPTIYLTLHYISFIYIHGTLNIVITS